MRQYEYIGSADFIPKGEFPARMRLDGWEALGKWMLENREELDIEECIPATFVVDTDGVMWIADRGSEHVACARLGRVLSAGEIFFTGLGQKRPAVHRITNQSTGYCPEPESWIAVERALSNTGIEFPDEFDPAFEFRMCPACSALAIVKDEDYSCLMCGADLPPKWNVQLRDNSQRDDPGADLPSRSENGD